MGNKQDSREVALERFRMIAPLLKPDIEASEKRRLKNEIISRENISERTLRRYIAAYRDMGFDGLLPKERSDKGKTKVPDNVLEEAAKLKEEIPERSVNRIIKVLEGEGIINKGSVSRSTLSRHLVSMGYSKKELKAKRECSQASRRFQKEHRNTLWQSDLKYGPYIPDPKNPDKKIRTYLVAFIDDATRFVCHAEFYADQKLPVLEDCFRKSLIKCGVPEGIYVDNGKIFISKWFRIACARLNIRHINARPYSPESKGKIERFNQTVEEFIREVQLIKPKTLEELNKLFRVWLDEGYNHKEHSALNGMSHAVKFASDTKAIRFVTLEECRDCFMWEETRSVDKTGCISLKGKLYEVGIEFIRKKVDIRYDPFDMNQIEVWHCGAKKKMASLLSVGEYCATHKVKEDEMKKNTSSRLLDVLKKDNKARNKKKLEAIVFRNVKEGEKNV